MMQKMKCWSVLLVDKTCSPKECFHSIETKNVRSPHPLLFLHNNKCLVYTKSEKNAWFHKCIRLNIYIFRKHKTTRDHKSQGFLKSKDAHNHWK